MMRKHVVAGRHRRVGREYGALTDDLARFGVGGALLDQFTHAFQCEKRGVTLVRVPDGGGDF